MKKRSLRTNSLFARFPKTALSTLVQMIYFWSVEESAAQTSQHIAVTPQLVGRVFKDLRQVCSLDIVHRPFIPFGGPNAICKCDESKFNHKSKVCLLFDANIFATSRSLSMRVNHWESKGRTKEKNQCKKAEKMYFWQ